MIKRFTIQIIIRITALAVTCLLFAIFINQKFWFTVAGLAFLITIQILSLVRYVNETNYSLSKFLNALKNEDLSVYFSPPQKGKSFAALYRDFNTIIGIFKRNKIEKEAQYKHFKHILEHVNLGIISIRKEDIEDKHSENEILFLNRAASEILDQPRHKYWHRLARQVPWFADEVQQISNGGKKLLEVGTETLQKQLSLEVVNIHFLEIPYLIITFHDIRSEIEQKEMEAWHNVIRVLAHEMLNSFTPVSSLAATIKSMTENDQSEILKTESIDNETIKDINLAAATIKKRSDGLLDFVQDYRTISNVPVPKMKKVNVKEFLQSIERLMHPVLEEKGIQLKIGQVPSNATLQFDAKLIEQIFINIIGNSIHALEKKENPVISINCEVKDLQTSILITDNGKGIPDDILKQIFIPFFTTRKDGSGIGLSLSKNLMKQHNGQLLVSSEEGIYTTFSLIFPNGMI